MENALTKELWSTEDKLRATMDASEYKNYILGLVVYKYLSDKLLKTIVEQAGESFEVYPTCDKQVELYQKLLENQEEKEDLLIVLRDELGYMIEPDYLFNVLVKQIKEGTFKLEQLEKALTNLSNSNEDFLNMFEDVDLYSRKLGNDEEQQTLFMSDLLCRLEAIDLIHYDSKSLGNVFESLIDKFSSDSGKKVEDFFTPTEVSTILARIVTSDNEKKDNFSVYDPTMGTGSLLLKVGEYTLPKTIVHYYGQELNTVTYHLAQMNFIMHNIPSKLITLKNGDTLNKDWPIDEPTTFDSVVMNPPYSAKWSADKVFLSDKRFESFDKLAPKSKADLAFLLHGLYHLNETGTMAIVLPHGVLFRGAAEGDIRKKLLESGNIEAVIGMPPNLFYGTAIPTAILVLKKSRPEKDVLFIDASRDFEKEKLQNKLSKENIEKLITTYREKKEVKKYSYLASFEEIQDNEYNLNIPRYVDTFEDIEPINVARVSEELKRVRTEKQQLSKKMKKTILTLDKDEIKNNNIKAVLDVLSDHLKID